MTRGHRLILISAAATWGGAWIGLTLEPREGGCLGIAAGLVLLAFKTSPLAHVSALALAACGLAAARGQPSPFVATPVVEGVVSEWYSGSRGTLVHLSTPGRAEECRAFFPHRGVAWLDRFPEGFEPGARVRVRFCGPSENGQATAASGVEILAPPGMWGRLAGVAVRTRALFRDQARKRLLGADTTPEKAFLLATVAGDPGALDQDTWRDLKFSGLAHQAVVSGLQVGLLAWTFSLLLAPFAGTRSRWRQAAVLGGAALALLFLPSDPPVRRAGWALVLARGGRLGGRDITPLGALGLGVLALLLAEPRWARSWSMALTASATAALVLAGSRPGLGRFWRVAVAPVMATWPLLVVMTDLVSPWSLIANLAGSPAVLPALLGGWGAVLFPSSWETGRAWSLDVGRAGAWWTLQVARHLAGWPGSGSLAAPATLGWAIVHEVLLLTWLLRPPRWKWWLFPALLCSWAWVLRPSSAGFATFPSIEVLDAGQGQSLVLRSGSSTVLIDAADDRSPEGTRRVLSHLRKRGISTVDALLLTQDDRDHAGGSAILIQALRPAEVLLPHTCLDSLPGGAVVRAASRFGIPVKPLGRGSIWSRTSLSFVVLHPQPGETPKGNETSLIAECNLLGMKVGLTGDVGSKTEESAVKRGLLSTVDVQIAGHHGAALSTSPLLLEAWRPHVVAISCGRNNSFGHPHPDTLRRLEQRNIPFWTTAEWGSIRVERKNDRLEVSFPDHGTVPVRFTPRFRKDGA